MDCNNNDGTNYIYQMQQTMNSALNSGSVGGGSMAPTSLSGIGQPPQQPAYDKKPSFDVASNSQPQYQQLNGHHHTPVNSSSSSQFNAPHSIYSQQSPAAAPSAGGVRQPAASPYSNSDFNNFNHPSNFYGNYSSGFGQPLNHHPAHVNAPHPVNHSPATTPSSSASSVNPLNHHPNAAANHHHSTLVNHHHHQQPPPATTNQLMKPDRSVPLPYDHHQHASSSTNPTTIYNHLHSNHHHLPSHGQLPGNHHPLPNHTMSSSAGVLGNSNSSHPHLHHNPSVQQPAAATTSQHSAYHHPSQNSSYHPSHHQSIQHPFNSNSGSSSNSSPAVNSTASRTAASPSSAAFNPQHPHHANYYNFNSSDPWKGYPPAQQQLASSVASPPQPSTNPVQINSQLTNLNNSANLSQPYASMHISGNSMNSSLNNSIGNGSIAGGNYMQQMNSSGNYSHYPIESNPAGSVQQNHHHHQFLASPPPHSDFNNSMTPMHPQQQHQYHQQQQTPSSPHPNLTVVVVNNNSNSNSSSGSNQRPKSSSKSKNSNNSMNSSLNSSTGGKNEQNQKRQSSLSEIDETLDAVVSGLKPKRKRNRSKASKEKGGKKEPKATSAYALFFKKVQNDLKKQSPEMKFGEISKTVAHKWGCLPEEDKQGYRLITEQDRKSRIDDLAKEKAMKISELSEPPLLEPKNELLDN